MGIGVCVLILMTVPAAAACANGMTVSIASVGTPNGVSTATTRFSTDRRMFPLISLVTQIPRRAALSQGKFKRPTCYPDVLVASLRPGVILLCFTAAASAQSSVLLDAMNEELGRNFTLLKAKADPAPYFLSYEVTEEDSHGVSATLGAITNDSQGKSRRLDVCVRVGTPKLDNYRRVRGERTQFTSGAALTFEDKPDSIEHRIWLETDRAYRLAAERLIKIRTNA